ncbi:MAG: helix-turn-helix domain-containing protein [Alicyclobacillaceae bacterium]|nr:helix-turn-helix domain-containing protein [Alicyclobacillaceae bacterium]
MEVVEGVGARLKHLRESRGMKQTFAAAQIGVTQSTLSAYENGYRSPPLSLMQRLAALYDTTVESILQGTPMRDRGPVELSDLVTDANLTFLGLELTEEEKKTLHKTLLEMYWEAKARKNPS